MNDAYERYLTGVKKLPKPDDLIDFTDEDLDCQIEEFSCGFEYLLVMKVSQFYPAFLEEGYSHKFLEKLPEELNQDLQDLLFQMCSKSYIQGFYDSQKFNIGDYMFPEAPIRCKDSSGKWVDLIRFPNRKKDE